MSVRLGSYPDYKDSILPWLRDVPEHWDTTGLRRVLRSRDGIKIGPFGSQLKLEYMGEAGFKVYGQSNVIARDFRHGTKYVARERYDGLKACDVAPGDLLITMMGTTGRCATVPSGAEPGIMDSHLLRIRANPDLVLPEYLVRLLDEAWYVKHQIEMRGKGSIMQGLNSAIVKSLVLELPPRDEQEAIVRFLDHADRRVNRLIRAKRRLIALLNEQKQAIIHRAVTRGLDPNVRLKPSGIDWLGDIPEHWETSRVKNEFRCLNRRRVPLSATERGEMTTRRYEYYGASGVIDRVDDYLFDGDLLLIAEDGANLVLRNLPLAIIARGKFWVNNHAHILEPRRGNLEFLSAMMETLSYKPWISGAAQPKLTQDRLMGITIAVPPRHEQDQIIGTVQEQTRSIRGVIDRTEREIALAREYRTRLIADVVTGKLDVREASASLADEAGEQEIADETEVEFEEDEGVAEEPDEAED